MSWKLTPHIQHVLGTFFKVRVMVFKVRIMLFKIRVMVLNMSYSCHKKFVS